MEGRKHLYILILAVLPFCPSFLPAMSESESSYSVRAGSDDFTEGCLAGREGNSHPDAEKPVAQNDGSWPEISFV